MKKNKRYHKHLGLKISHLIKTKHKNRLAREYHNQKIKSEKANELTIYSPTF